MKEIRTCSFLHRGEGSNACRFLARGDSSRSGKSTFVSERKVNQIDFVVQCRVRPGNLQSICHNYVVMKYSVVASARGLTYM